MKTEVYTCDLCKKSVSREDLCQLSVHAEGIAIKSADRYHPLRVDVCKDCLKRKGFVVDRPDKMEIAEAQKRNQATLEDKLCEILEDLGVAFTE